jgi:hypothetical protein
MSEDPRYLSDSRTQTDDKILWVTICLNNWIARDEPSRMTRLKSGVSSIRNLINIPITTGTALARKGIFQPQEANCSSLRYANAKNDAVPSAVPSGKPINQAAGMV